MPGAVAWRPGDIRWNVLIAQYTDHSESRLQCSDCLVARSARPDPSKPTQRGHVGRGNRGRHESGTAAARLTTCPHLTRPGNESPAAHHTLARRDGRRGWQQQLVAILAGARRTCNEPLASMRALISGSAVVICAAALVPSPSQAPSVYGGTRSCFQADLATLH